MQGCNVIEWGAPVIEWAGDTLYDYQSLATSIGQRWIQNNQRVYENTGKLVEKYNVTDMGLKAGGGEYPVQDGFGWTNGVFLRVKSILQEE